MVPRTDAPTLARVTLAIACVSPPAPASDAPAPAVPGRVIDVTAHGAAGDGATLDTAAIQAAIDAAADAGGGTVHFPAGDYLSGTLRLRDRVSLHLSIGATLWGSPSIEHYDPEHRHLLYAKEARDIAISGRGAIDGNGPRFWDGGRLEAWLRGEGELVRPADMLRFERCEKIAIEDVEVRHGAFWNIAFSECGRVTLRALTLINGIYEEDGPNTDGVNLWNCQKVVVSDCDFQTGDDCLVVLGNSRDVRVTNCRFTTTETALMISGVRNLAFSNSTIHDAGCGVGFRVWNEIVVDGVVVDNVVMDVSDRFDTGGQAIYLWSFPVYTETPIHDTEGLPPPGEVRNVTFSNITATVNGGIFVTGYREPEGHVENLTFDNVRIHMRGNVPKHPYLNENPPDPYPIYGFHGAPYAMYLRHVRDLTLRNVHFTWNAPEQPDWGAALRCVSVGHLTLEGFRGRQGLASGAPAVWLKDVDRAFVRGCQAPEGTGAFLGLSGSTGDVTLIGNDLSRARAAFEIEDGCKATVFTAANRMPGDS